MKMLTLEESIAVLRNHFYAIDQLIDRNLTLDSKTAMFNTAEINGDILNYNFTYNEKINEQDLPNGYRLEEIEEGTITLSSSNNIPIYLVENVLLITPEY